jgi:hypothetical protein
MLESLDSIPILAISRQQRQSHYMKIYKFVHFSKHLNSNYNQVMGVFVRLRNVTIVC